MSSIRKPSTTARSRKSQVTATTPSPSAAPTRNEVVLQALISGLLANRSTLPNITLATGDVASADLVAMFQKGIATIQAAQSAKAAWRTAVEAQAAEMATLLPIVESLKLSLRARFGPKSLVLSQFGIRPLATRAVSVATKAAAVVKRRATKARKGGAVAGAIAVPPVTGSTPVSTTAAH